MAVDPRGFGVAAAPPEDRSPAIVSADLCVTASARGDDGTPERALRRAGHMPTETSWATSRRPGIPNEESLQIGIYRRFETSRVRCKKAAPQKSPFCRVFCGASLLAGGADCRGLPAILGVPGTGDPQCLKGPVPSRGPSCVGGGGPVVATGGAPPGRWPKSASSDARDVVGGRRVGIVDVVASSEGDRRAGGRVDAEPLVVRHGLARSCAWCSG
jgi:hypothetical protein